jgi:hypothetical protein
MKNSEKKIAARAYQKYTQKGGKHGNDLADWLEAEKEIKAEEKAKTKKPAAKAAKKTSQSVKKAVKKSR